MTAIPAPSHRSFIQPPSAPPLDSLPKEGVSTEPMVASVPAKLSSAKPITVERVREIIGKVEEAEKELKSKQAEYTAATSPVPQTGAQQREAQKDPGAAAALGGAIASISIVFAFRGYALNAAPLLTVGLVGIAIVGGIALIVGICYGIREWMKSSTLQNLKQQVDDQQFTYEYERLTAIETLISELGSASEVEKEALGLLQPLQTSIMQNRTEIQSKISLLSKNLADQRQLLDDSQKELKELRSRIRTITTDPHTRERQIASQNQKLNNKISACAKEIIRLEQEIKTLEGKLKTIPELPLENVKELAAASIVATAVALPLPEQA